MAGNGEVVERARSQLIERCMLRRGFVYAPPAEATGPPPEERFGDFLGVTNLGRAQQYGYHASPEVAEQAARREQAAQQQVAAPPSPEYLAALTGGGRGAGCVDEVAADLGIEDGTDPDNLIGQLVDRSITTVLQSDAYRAALERWRNCMAEAGFEPPAVPFDLIPRYGRAPSTTAEERAVATADVNCKASSGLVVTWMRGMSQVQAGLAEENAEAVQSVRRAEQMLLDRAEQVLAGS